MSIGNYIFPFFDLYKSSNKINEKLEKLNNPEQYEFEYATTDPQIKREVLDKTLALTLDNKKQLEDKAKSSLVAITISAALIFNVMQMLKNLQNSTTVVISVILTIISGISLLYMVIAGVLSLYTLSEINRVSFLFPQDTLLSKSEQKEALAQSIEQNYLYNTKRNNFMCTSYKCIIISISLFVVIFAISLISMLCPKESGELDPLSKIETIEEKLAAVDNRIQNIEMDFELLNGQYDELKESYIMMTKELLGISFDLRQLRNEVDLKTYDAQINAIISRLDAIETQE